MAIASLRHITPARVKQIVGETDTENKYELEVAGKIEVGEDRGERIKYIERER